MEDSENFNLIRLQYVDDAIVPFNDFSNLIAFKFRHNPARVWECRNLLRSAGDSIDDPLGVGWGGLGKEGVDVGEVIDRGVGPVDIHGLSPNILRTSSTGLRRPAALSASPAAIVCWM
jgi:hypothetical protein